MIEYNGIPWSVDPKGKYGTHPVLIFEALGLIPSFLHESDPRPAAEQLNANYQHGGGWRAMPGWTMNPTKQTIHYEADPDPLYPLARAQLREETILMYPNAWVAILQRDGSFEVCRMD